tara:strand:- start:2838 stop:4004 length:1167 start_codon:yes stop_codon:yes gene_type:complete
MADPFSTAPDDFFDREFAPLRNTYGLTRSERDYFGSLEDARMAPQLNTLLKLSSHLSQQRNSDLAYQASLFEFEEKKRKAREEIENEDRVAQVTQDLGVIINSDKDVFDKQRDLAAYGMTNTGVFKKSDVARMVMAAAEKSVQAEKAKISSLEANKGTLYGIAQLGEVSPEEFDARIKEDGVVTQTEKDLSALNKATYARRQKLLKTSEAESEAKTRSEAIRLRRAQGADRLKALDDIEQFIKQVAADTPKTKMVAEEEGGKAFEQDLTTDEIRAYQRAQLQGIPYSETLSFGEDVTIASAYQNILKEKQRIRSQFFGAVAPPTRQGQTVGSSMREAFDTKAVSPVTIQKNLESLRQQAIEEGERRRAELDAARLELDLELSGLSMED